MKKILLLSTGGTISQVHTEDGISVSNENSTKGKDFINILENTRKNLNIDKLDSKTILNKDSSNIIQEDWKLIIHSIVEEYDNFDAFIVTHGTNTLGYTCAATSFALTNLGKPVIFTGSQVPYGIPGSDALINLENTLKVITEHEELVGVFAILGSKIITGTRVKKKTEYEYDAFTSFGRIPSIGTIGNTIVIHKMALEHHLSFLGNRARTKNELIVQNNFDNNIISLTEFPGLQSKFIKTLADSGIKGFIMRGTGSGDLNIVREKEDYDNLNDAFAYLKANKIPIIATTQAPQGVASMNINEPGQLATKKLNVIPAWDMSIEAITTKLSWLIAQNKSYDEIRELMLTPLKGEISTSNLNLY